MVQTLKLNSKNEEIKGLVGLASEQIEIGVLYKHYYNPS